jgi:hypothetical protein
VAIFRTKNAVIKNIQREPMGNEGGQPVLTLNNCEDALITDCLALPGTPAFLGLSGSETKKIAIVGNAFENAEKAVLRSSEVPAVEPKN